MTSITLHRGDNRQSLRRLIDQGVRVHSVVTDPPYSLTSIVKRFGKDCAAPAKFGRDGAFARASAGFMGLQWDATGIEYDPQFWALIYEILLPGGFVFAFSSPRTGHRQACAMEMVGFIMHPFHGWLYGSGMPKAHNPCPAIDKLMGAEGGRGAPKPGHEAHMGKDNLKGLRDGNSVGAAEGGFARPWMNDPDAVENSHYQYAPTSPEAQQWDGWRYGTQTQKPAMEPIYLAQKPYSEKTGTANLLKHGVGAFNIEGCRVDGQRWPANILHDGSDEVINLFPREAGTSAPVRGTEPTKNGFSGVVKYGGMLNRVSGENTFYGDSGSAARFFNNFDYDEYDLAIAAGLIDDMRDFELPIALYHGKATKVDRAGGKHPTVKPVGLLQHLVRHITPPGGIVLDPFAGSGTTAEAARREGFDCLLMEAEPEYIGFLERRFSLIDDFDDLLGPEFDFL